MWLWLHEQNTKLQLTDSEFSFHMPFYEIIDWQLNTHFCNYAIQTKNKGCSFYYLFQLSQILKLIFLVWYYGTQIRENSSWSCQLQKLSFCTNFSNLKHIPNIQMEIIDNLVLFWNFCFQSFLMESQMSISRPFILWFATHKGISICWLSFSPFSNTQLRNAMKSWKGYCIAFPANAEVGQGNVCNKTARLL